MAQTALVQFQSRKYEECLQTINELLEIRQNDPKVCHNLGIAQFYKSSCTRLDELTKVFDNVSIQVTTTLTVIDWKIQSYIRLDVLAYPNLL